MTTLPNPAMLTKAVLRAGELFGLAHALPDIIGLTSAEWSKIANGERLLDPSAPEWQAATRFAGTFRALLTLAGSTDSARTWLATPHQTLGDAPAALLRTPEGQERVYRYLDAVQKYEIKLPPRGARDSKTGKIN